MPILQKTIQKKYESELRDRYATLLVAIGGRELTSSVEGAGGGHWPHPETLCATRGTPMEIRVACADFSAILAELKRLK